MHPSVLPSLNLIRAFAIFLVMLNHNFYQNIGLLQETIYRNINNRIQSIKYKWKE